MSKLIEIITKDGSFTLKSEFFQENFHSLKGALEETKIKFTNPSYLQRFNGNSLSVLDICFGLGYNSASLFSDLLKQNSFLNWYALEIDKKPLEYSLRNKSFLKLWHPKVSKIFKHLYKKNQYIDQSFQCNIIWGDARKEINNIPSKIKFDLIYLDGFSPQKCPQVWTIEFLSKIVQKLNPNGYLITYSSAAAVRMTLRNLGLEILSIKPNLNSKSCWSIGTVAITEFDNANFQNNLCFGQLSIMEEEHLLTKASIPYRDPGQNSKAVDIIKKRAEEQFMSNLMNTKDWREKWK